ncbi:MAG: hypothetical protein LQ342_005739 [Letrouitia transgressa]|nr:MAG: hypothetical protein LQ342_005739 [Letrouitia transgressa]
MGYLASQPLIRAFRPNAARTGHRSKSQKVEVDNPSASANDHQVSRTQRERQPSTQSDAPSEHSSPSKALAPRPHKPKHVPIVITQDVIDSVLKHLPDSPDSVDNNGQRLLPSPTSVDETKESISPGSVRRPRHIPIIIPSFAQPYGTLPPTPASLEKEIARLPSNRSVPSSPGKEVARLPSNPPTPSSLEKEIARIASNPSFSCSSVLPNMSRPTTSGSRTSTLDSNASAPSPEQLYSGRFQQSSSSYLNDRSSSQSSLNQDGQSNRESFDRQGRTSETLSPALGQQPQVNGAGTTNLSGLVCNVHKCTGKEPHALVGATTTILGDKLYVFGGRQLSRRRPPLTSDMYELDLVKRHWTKVETIGDIPAPRYFHSACALGDNKLICYGGMSPASASPTRSQSNAPQPSSNPMDPQPEVVVMSDIHIYDSLTRTWTYIPTSNTPQGRYAHCAALLPSSAVFASANAPLSAIHHNPASANPHQGSLGVDLDGTGGAEMIVVGGQDSANHYIEQISVFNLRSLKWTATNSLGRSCGAYRSVVAPLSSLPTSRIGLNQADNPKDGEHSEEQANEGSSMLIYSNYNFLDVKLELQVRLADGSLVEKSMNSQFSPPGLRFPNGGILDNHFVVSGTYLTSSKQEYALWALDLKTLTWSRIDAGGSIFGQGSWNRGILWARRNTFVIIGNRKRSLVEDYNHRRINFSNICMVDLEAFGLYDNPRHVWPTSSYRSTSAPILPPPLNPKANLLGGRPLSSAAVALGQMCLALQEFADMDLIALSGERLPVNSHVLARRWGPYFVHLLRESTMASSSASTYQNDSNSSHSGTNTLRPLNSASQSTTSRNSSITITPSITASQHSAGANSSLVPPALSHASPYPTSFESVPLDPPSAFNLSPPSRPRQLYLPHTLHTLKALVHFLYTSSLPPASDQLCTPQILCSLLQLARPYRVDGLLEAVAERLHQVLDGRNAAAVFNAAAMAAGGGRGTGSLFGAEGVEPVDAGQPQPLNEATLGAAAGIARAAARMPETQRRHDDASVGTGTESGSEDGSSSVVSGATSMESSFGGTSESGSSELEANGLGRGRGRERGREVVESGDGEVWTGGMSCVIGLQKRGLRGLMEGRRMRERGKSAGPVNGVVGLGVS